mmetsp:Transcript_9528/g.13645  ORF Transcript_9528/g.13645 Transcript_9528/m.13645 type:complete len:130 (-) Transcript_9528:127-516(-)|eukprot:CAMPEP_0201693922 /NCGR_PEP_ID=MMETSP0578-20130828/6364_1 /ASSEMBLY_ACC=CAM_ASM_000663 /TAXON_ID=267565 /ORGANISM="Skeletonema grethea, Strain CCMP 1804" /LENGTH=129 /DNA_ID=CAMNT_0048179531 /DNA_START=106 /DNA_END=495 /DNA_ORIENTATION=-
MKSFFLVTFTLLAAAASISAFAPNYSRNTVTASRIKLDMARSKPAKSQEEDLELTRSVIMKHIGSMEDFVVDDVVEETEPDDDESDESGSLKDRLKDAIKDKLKDSVKDRLREKGREIKDKLKSRIQKD